MENKEKASKISKLSILKIRFFSFPKKFLIYLILLYQKHISPLFGARCKYYPTCSQYAMEAIDKYGIIIGSIRAFFRIIRCNPLSKRRNR